MNVLPGLTSMWPELDRLLDEALDLSEPERESWLVALQGTGAALRETLRRLLEADARARTADFLGTLPRVADAAVASVAVAGDNVGPYRLVEPLGEGGMGAVWLAERVDGGLARKVALKLPRVAWGDALEQRMARERDILASLTHPNIARLYDAGVDLRGRPWLALEHVQGKPIDAAALERQLTVRARLELLLQVCDAVAYAHSRLVIHRDLKPSNILVTDDGQVRLLDFGIAKLVQGEQAEPTELTRLGGHAMTPDYASPEQIRGDALSTSSDVYSLGVVAYELLAGQRPYRLRRRSAAELEQAILSVDPPQASDATEAPALKKQLRGDLDAILNKALKKSPAERYPTPSALADDIARHLRGDAVLARPDSRLYRLTRFVSRYRLAVAAVSAVMLALSTGLGVALWQAEQARQSERQARTAHEREDVVKDLYLETLTQIAAWNAATFAQPGSVSRKLQDNLEDFERRYADSPDRRAGLLEVVSTNLPFMNDYVGSEKVARRSQAALKQAGAPSRRHLRAAVNTARALLNLGQLPEAETVLAQALAEWPAEPDNLANRALVLSEFAKVVQGQGRREEAAAAHGQAVASLDSDTRASERFNVRLAQGRLYLGYDHAQAIRLLQETHDEYVRLPDAFPVEVGYSHYMLGSALHLAGRPAEAEAAFRETVRRWEPFFGKSDFDAVMALAKLARTMSAQGRHDEALALLKSRWSELASEAPSAEVQKARVALIAHQFELEVARGDPAAALAMPAIDPADARPLLRDYQYGAYVRALVQARLWRGQAEQAVNDAVRWRQAMPAAAASGPHGLSIDVATIEAELALGSSAAALHHADALIEAIRRERATATWLYREALESASLARALAAGDAVQAWAHGKALHPWSADMKELPPAPSLAASADSLLRQAQVLRLAGRDADVQALAARLEAALASERPGSPRRLAWRRLSVATR